MYGTVQDLRVISQIEITDLELVPAAGQTEEDRLNEILAGFLRTAKEYIDLDRERDFELEGAVPEGIKSIALRIGANMVQDMIDRQDAKVVKRDQSGNVMFKPSRILTDDLKIELSLYNKGSKLPISSWPRFSRVRSTQEIEDALYDTTQTI